ncbi:MAG: glycosyltransferase [Raineya sp.]|nr:glycosyltransferase [Raineya sp.]
MPLVSVIALSYNHAPFIEEAFQSLWKQSFQNWEVIIVDDASTDNSPEIIRQFLHQNPCQKVKTCIFHKENQGNCKSFNEALALCEGKYVIDFALDDVMHPQRLEKQVLFFEKQPEKVGLIFSNAQIIDEKSRFLKYHYPIDRYGKAKVKVPQENFFRAVLERYFICPPTMMFRKSMLQELGGYNENLAYEDFDLWIRASQEYDFAYLDEITTLYRKHKSSLSQKFYQKKQNILLLSTLQVLQKAYHFCKDEQDFKALARNIQYHLRQSYFSENFEISEKYAQLLEKENLKRYKNCLTKTVLWLAKNKLSLSKLYQMYYRIRYGS